MTDPSSKDKSGDSEPKKQIGCFIDRYAISPGWQFITLSVVTALFVVLYFAIHHCFKDEYNQDVSEIIQSGVKVFQIVGSSDTNHLTLQFYDQELALSEFRQASTPFGTGEMISVLGCLSSYQTDIQHFNLNAAQRLRSLGTPVPLSATSVGVPLQIFDHHIGGWKVVDKQRWEELSNSAGVLSFLELRLLLTQGRYATEIKPLSTDESDFLKAPEFEKNISSHRKTSTAQLAEQLKLIGQREGDFVARYQYHRLDTTLRNKIADTLDIWWNDLLVTSQVLTSVKGICATDNASEIIGEQKTPAITESADCPINEGAACTMKPDQFLREYNERLQQDLSSIVITEMGFFWVAGNWRWLEFAIWAVFGVLVQALIHQGRALRDYEDWDWNLNDSIHVVGKIFFAPLLVVAVFFIARFAGLESESQELVNSTLVPLGLAFILGMFPITSYNLMKTLVESLLRAEISQQPTRNKVPQKRRVVTESKPNTLSELEKGIKQTVTAPLDHENLGGNNDSSIR